MNAVEAYVVIRATYKTPSGKRMSSTRVWTGIESPEVESMEEQELLHFIETQVVRANQLSPNFRPLGSPHVQKIVNEYSSTMVVVDYE